MNIRIPYHRLNRCSRLRFLRLSQITKFDDIRRVCAPKSIALAENLLNLQENTSFLFNFSKPVEPIILKSAGPISQHTALEGTLNVISIRGKCIKG